MRWTSDEIGKLKECYTNKMHINDIANKLHRSYKSVEQKATRLGFTGNANRKYEYDKNFWSNYNKYNCYFAGWIAADGCIAKRRSSKGWRLSFNIKDKELLENFVYRAGSNYPIKEYPSTSLYHLSMTVCDKWARELERNFSITPRKTRTLEFPSQIPEELFKYYLIGFIDGDGCFHLPKKSNYLSLSFKCGSYDFLNKLNIWLESYFPSREKKKRKVMNHGNNFSLYMHGKITWDLYRALQQEIPECHLKRKWEKF